MIKNIEQLDQGGNNPKSGIFESTLWQLNFDDDSEPRILGRTKMLEYLSKGTSPAKTVHAFKKWEITTVAGTKIRTWVIVYDDKSHTQLVNKDFYSLLTNGHKNKDEEQKEEQKKLEEKQPTAPQNPVLFDDSRTTTVDERQKLDEFRKKTISEMTEKEKDESVFFSEVRKDYGSNPDSTGYEETK
jgi:hypothetical protein